MVWPLNVLYRALVEDANAKHREILAAIAALQSSQGKIMTDINKLQADEAAELAAIEDLATGQAAAIAKITEEAATIADLAQQVRDLKAQQASGSPITAAQLDALDDGIMNGTAKIKTITALLAASVASATPVPVTPPATPPATPPTPPAEPPAPPAENPLAENSSNPDATPADSGTSGGPPV